MNIIRRIFNTQYRLTTIRNGKLVHTYCFNKRVLKRMVARFDDAEYWTIYKRGPFGIPERPICSGDKLKK